MTDEDVEPISPKTWAIVFTLLSLTSFVVWQVLLAEAIGLPLRGGIPVNELVARLETLSTAISVVSLLTWLFLFLALITIIIALPDMTREASEEADALPLAPVPKVYILLAVVLVIILIIVLALIF